MVNKLFIFVETSFDMNTLLFFTLVIIGLATVLIAWKNQQKLVPVFQILFAVTAFQWMATAFDDASQYVFHALTGVMVVGFIIAQFLRNNAWINSGIALALIVGFFFLFGNKTMAFNGESFVAVPKFIMVAFVLATVGVPIAALKLQFFKKWIPVEEHAGWLQAFSILLAGIALFLGYMAATWFGVLLVGSAFLLSSVLRKDPGGNIGISMIVLALSSVLMGNSELDLSLLKGDLLEGMFFGGFGIFLLHKIWSAEHPRLLPVFLGYFFAFAVVVGVGLAGTIEMMGGMDAYIGALVGAALVHAAIGHSFVGVSYFAPVLAFGLLLPSLLVNEEEVEAQEKIITMEGGVDENGDVVAPPTVLPLSELSGPYAFVKDSSQVQFVLGKKGETKGMFKKVEGALVLNEDMSKSMVKVKLDMSDFTTFNKMRDEHLVGDEYFNTSKYPNMRFSGTNFKSLGNEVYEVEGSFLMLGVSKPVTVKLQRIESGDKLMLIGSGQLDRTAFGMTPSAAEGNIVDFNFQVEFRP